MATEPSAPMSPSTHTVKVLTRTRLRRLNNKALKNGAAQSIRTHILDRLSDEHIYPVSMSLLHNDVEVRCTIVLDAQGHVGMLDITLADYDAIPTISYITPE